MSGSISSQPPQGSTLSPRALNRAYLERQLLSRRSSMDAGRVIEHLVGMQSQAPQAPFVGLWARMERFEPEELSRMMVEREAVRIALMRGTVHLVTAADGLALRPLVQVIFDRDRERNVTFGAGVRGMDPEELAAAGRALVEERPLTAVEIGKGLAERWPERDPASMAHSIRALLPLVQVPPRGTWRGVGAARSTTAESWLGRPLETSPSVRDMIVRYLRAFGPATVGDVQSWSGLPGLRGDIDAMRTGLRVYRDERGRELFDTEDGVFADEAARVPVRLIPEYDNVLMSHNDRSRVIPQEHRDRVVRNLGQPMFLVDGFVAGQWKLRREKAMTTLALSPFHALSSGERDTVEAEARALLRFVAEDGRESGVEWSDALDT